MIKVEIITSISVAVAATAFTATYAQNPQSISTQIRSVLKDKVIATADLAIALPPITITANRAANSAGGLHDFYSDGDYWWPNPADVNGPFIQKDGQSNPNNFNAHRNAVTRLSQIIGSLASAYVLTKNERYVKAAFVHLNAWFINDSTYMNPSLLYAQAIKGKVTGRSTGIIDMIQMVEVAQGIRVMEHAHSVNKNDLAKIKKWFAQYLQWVTTHPYGVEEREAKNNHGTCWVMQVAIFAKLTNNDTLMQYCTNRYKTVLLPNQLATDGSFPLELKRTKPYGYSLFNMDALAAVCHILSSSKENIWNYQLSDGRNLKNAVDYMHPFVANKASWPFAKDVMYWDEWPVAQPFLFFNYLNSKNAQLFNTWKGLEHFPTTAEVIRNLPIRNPIIWLD